MKFFAQLSISPQDIGFGGLTSEGDAIVNTLNVVYFWAGAAAVVVLVIAGFIYVISAGDSSRIAQAKNAIIGAVAGLVVVGMAYAITNFVIGAFS